jgi:hypothetical protein
VIEAEYDQITDQYRAYCHDCNQYVGPAHDSVRDADRDAYNHENTAKPCTA